MNITHLITLKKNFKGDFTNDDEILDAYSRDASLFWVRPVGVFFPLDAEDIKTLVRNVLECNARGGNFSLTARAGGTDMTGGSLTESLVVDVKKYMNKIKEIGADYAITEPGVYYRDFEKETLKRKLLLPSYPASREICTVGGMVANNSGGEKTLAYGKTEDYVREIKMVCEDGEEHLFKPLTFAELEEKKNRNNFEGEIYKKLHALVVDNDEVLKEAKPKVNKNSSGYFLWNVLDKEKQIFNPVKLLVGSQGTLGIITEIKIGLIRPNEFTRMLVVFLNDLKLIPEVAERILAHKPESFESYDNHTFSVALKFLPELLKHMSGNIVSLAIKFLPEFWMAITGGIPKMILIAEFSAKTDEEAKTMADGAKNDLTGLELKAKTTGSASEAKKYWAMRRESFNLLRHHVKNLRTAPFIDDIIVLPEKLGEFLPKLYEILGAYDLTYTVAGHIGDGNFHIIPLMDLREPKTEEIISELSKKVYDLVVSFHGSISAEHNDGLIRTPFLKVLYGEKICALFAETKNIFDPGNIFNPLKKVGATMEYAMSHIDNKS